jgi:hypothetical protein
MDIELSNYFVFKAFVTLNEVKCLFPRPYFPRNRDLRDWRGKFICRKINVFNRKTGRPQRSEDLEQKPDLTLVLGV